MDANTTRTSRPIIVISGVNLVDLGPLSIFRDALQSLVLANDGRYEIVALVSRKCLLNIPGVTYIEFPDVKSAWANRLRFEYLTSFKLSQQLRPALWIAMHDMTPRVDCKRQFVYCHNPSPFYRFRLREALLDPKFGMFSLFYRFLYRILLGRNEAVIVQQDWIRKAFQEQFGARRVIVATPTIDVSPALTAEPSFMPHPVRFFYPAFSRTFKNHELILEAVQILEGRGIGGFELRLTIDAGLNACAADLFKRFGKLQSVRWLGAVSRERVYEMYGETDCLLFPSLLETWGLPLTEFKTTGRQILAADLPYAHETVGTYAKISFFDPNDAKTLADTMKRVIDGSMNFESVKAAPIAEPHAHNWEELWAMLFLGGA